jgi:hypothetical protein
MTFSSGWGYVFNATFNNISVISLQLFWWRNPECPEKTTDLPQVTDKLHIVSTFLTGLQAKRKYHV